MNQMKRVDRDPDDVVSPEVHPRPEQTRLPFDQPPGVPLPFDDEVDEPIGFALTARARRTVAPTTLPELSVVAGAGEEDPADTRASQARALRRAGASVGDIARQLRVDELLVRAWVDDVAARPGAPRVSGAARAAAVLAAPTGPADQEARPGAADDQRLAVRRGAVAEGRRRLRVDTDFAVGVGLIAGIGRFDGHGIGFKTDRPELASRVLAWVAQQAGADPRDVRVVLRLGKAVAGDLARHRWATVLDIDPGQIAFTRWRQASDEAAVEALVRVADPDVAARVAGWCEALLQPETDPADVAF